MSEHNQRYLTNLFGGGSELMRARAQTIAGHT